MSYQKFQKRILSWFDQHGRKNLPWQKDKTPYRVWASEIMLQQTQVTTVIPYFVRFINRFPDVESLAAATEDEVLHLWTGLGYYNRARNLHKTAKQITALGYFPNELTELENLPGIGRSTAGAILALAFGKKATILDGNVKRVLTRFTATKEWPGNKNVLAKLWELAESLTPHDRIADYTQAMMDLGATLCTRGKPLCEQCPLRKSCKAHQQGIAALLPQTKPQKMLPVRSVTFLIFNYKNRVLLEKRPPTGVWQGLWSFPEIPGLATIEEVRQSTQLFNFGSIKNIEPAGSFRHTFSHFHLDILPVQICLQKKSTKLQESETQMWYELNGSAVIGLPAPVKKILTSYCKQHD